jgi:transposase
MPDVPMLTDAQWRAVEPLLPLGRRDRRVLSAICFRESAGIGLRDLCEAYPGLTKTRVSDWTRALEADGSLPRILDTLRLNRAGSLSWRRGGVPSWRRRSLDGGRGVMALKLSQFSEQLGQSPRQRGPRR